MFFNVLLSVSVLAGALKASSFLFSYWFQSRVSHISCASVLTLPIACCSQSSPVWPSGTANGCTETATDSSSSMFQGVAGIGQVQDLLVLWFSRSVPYQRMPSLAEETATGCD